MPGVELRDVRTRRRPAVSDFLSAPMKSYEMTENECCLYRAETMYTDKGCMNDAGCRTARGTDATPAGGERYSPRPHRAA